jgi:hypothetical protein
VPGRRGGELRVSYRELDVEQLGSIYETLLALTPIVAADDRWYAVIDGRDVVLTAAQRADLARRRGEVDDTSGLVESAGEENEAEEDERGDDGASSKSSRARERRWSSSRRHPAQGRSKNSLSSSRA